MSGLADWVEANQLSCPIKSATGLDCPGCGMQRSFIALLRGDLVESFSLYPALLPLLLTLGMLVYFLIRPYRNGHLFLKIGYISTSVLVLGNFIHKLIH